VETKAAKTRVAKIERRRRKKGIKRIKREGVE